MVTVLIGTVAAIALSGNGPTAPAAAPALSRAMPSGLAGLELLPAAAHGPISAALGRDDPAYWVRGSRASNPAQGLRVAFGATGIAVAHESSHLGLSLAGFGRPGAMRSLGAVAPVIRANRVTYSGGPVTQWYANGPLGLEQGFTVARAPAGRGRLQLSIAITGGLRARISSGGVVFGHSLRYAGLVAVDALGRPLPAAIWLRGRQLVLSVDDRGARYPVRIDPFVQDANLTAPGTSTQTAFGYSSAVSGYTVAVGAPAATVGSNTSQGEVAVFSEPDTGWANTSQAALLTASDGAMGDGLGFSVAIDGGTIVAGAPQHAGVGAAYVYTEPTSGGWASTSHPTAELTPTGPENGYLPVAISGNTIVVGRGYQTVGGNAQQGVVDVFVKPASGPWASSSTPFVLTAANGVAQGILGINVAISPSTVTPTTIAAAALTTGSGPDGAEVYVFTEPGTGWASTSQPTAALQIGDTTGEAVFSAAPALADTGNTIAVGDTYETVGTNTSEGAVYVFSEPTTGGWVPASAPTATLTNPGGALGDELGFTVAASGSTVVATAPGADNSQGAVDVFDEPAGGWASAPVTPQVLTNSPAGAASELGYSVGFDGTTVVAGTRGHNLGEFVYQLPGTPPPSGSSGGATAVPVDTVAPTVSGTAKAGATLTCAHGTWTNSPTGYAYQWSRDGTPIVGATTSSYTVTSTDEQLTLTCTVTAGNGKGAGKPATSKGIKVPVKTTAKCPAATGSLSGTKLGLVSLGMTRTAARKAYTKSSNRGKKYQDFFCLTPIGIRVGYGSSKLARKYADHVIWASTSSAYYAVHGIRVGATITAAGKSLTLTGPYKVGLNTWYFTPNGTSNAIFKVRDGVIEEIGIADKALTATTKAKKAFLTSFS